MSKLVAVDDFLSKIFLVRNFLSEQGVDLDTLVYQDNQSTILMCKKGREGLSKRTHAMNMHYFAIKDNIEKGYLKVMHLGTQKMLGDFSPNPYKDPSSGISGI